MNAITIQRHNVAPLEFSTEQRQIILNSFLNGATAPEAAVLMELARIRRLNPITRQIHFVKRWNGERNCFTWEAQVGIDGFRAIAERTGLYDGQDEAEFTYAEADKDHLRPLTCKVRVYRKDWGRPAVGLVHLGEYIQKKKDGAPTKMWAEKPHVMLAKCAEAVAFRRGFPDDTAGLYAPEEMPDGERVAVANEAPALPAGAAPQAEAPAKKPKKQLKIVDADVVPSTPPPAPAAAPKVTYGPSKGKSLAELSGAELAAAIALGEERIAASPSALWASQVAACLANLKAEHGARIEAAIDADAAQTAAKEQTK